MTKKQQFCAFLIKICVSKLEGPHYKIFFVVRTFEFGDTYFDQKCAKLAFFSDLSIKPLRKSKHKFLCNSADVTPQSAQNHILWYKNYSNAFFTDEKKF